jgi:hypothetical protein
VNVGELFVLFGLKPKGWEKANELVAGLARAARRYIAIESVKSIAGFVEHATEAATHLVSLSQAMGMTVQQTQEWGYVAEQSGSNLKELSVGLNMFLRNIRLYSEGRGSKVLRDRFRELGLTADDAKMALAGPEGLQKVLLKTSDALHKMGAGGKQATFTQLFGVRAGRAMLADLSRGSEGLNELFERRRQMGELSGKQALEMRDLGNRIKDVKTSLSAMASTALAELAPALKELLDDAVHWIQAHGPLIRGTIRAAVKALELAFRAIGKVIKLVGDLIDKAFGGDTLSQAVIIGIAGAIMSVLVPALWAMAAPIIAVSLPLIGITLIVAAIAYGVLQLVKHWDQVKDAVGRAWDYMQSIPGKIEDAFVDAWDAVKDAVARAFEFIAELPVIKQLRELVDGIESIIGDKSLKGETYNTKNETALQDLASGKGSGIPTAGDLDTVSMLGGRTRPSVNVPGQAPAAAGAGAVQVNAPINMTVTGVKDADQAERKIQRAVDQGMRHAMRDLGGEVQ